MLGVAAVNGLGSMAKAWNYEGERLLRAAAQSDGLEYTIIRPGVRSDQRDATRQEKRKEDQTRPEQARSDQTSTRSTGQV